MKSLQEFINMKNLKLCVLLLIGLLFSATSYARETYDADYICYARDEANIKTPILYTIAALNPKLGPVATQLIVVRHDPKTKMQTVIAQAKKISMKNVTTASGDKGIKYAGESNGKVLSLTIVDSRLGLRAHSDFNGGYSGGMDCVSNSVLVVGERP